MSAAFTLIAGGRTEVRLREIAQALSLDKSAAARRIAAAVHLGYLRNLEDRKGRPARIVMGDAIPEETPVLPEAEALHCCSVVGRINDLAPSGVSDQAELPDSASRRN